MQQVVQCQRRRPHEADMPLHAAADQQCLNFLSVALGAPGASTSVLVAAPDFAHDDLGAMLLDETARLKPELARVESAIRRLDTQYCASAQRSPEAPAPAPEPRSHGHGIGPANYAQALAALTCMTGGDVV